MRLEYRLGSSISNFLFASTRSIYSGHRRYSVASSTNKGGLFGLGTVRSGKDFRLLTDRVYERGHALYAEAVAGRARKRKLVAVLDELSDTICQAADMAECVRMVHPNASFADEAEDCVVQLSQFVESLNSNRELYATLKRAAETDDSDSSCRTPLDDVDQRVMTLLIDDMESSGVHLEEAQRRQFLEFNSGIFTIGSEFVRAAQEFKAARNIRMTTTDDFLQKQKNRLKTLLTLRYRLASLVGFKSYAQRAVKGSFLETPEQVNQFLKILVDELHQKKLLDDVITQSQPVVLEPSSVKRQDEIEEISLSLKQLIGDKVNKIAEYLAGLRFERQEAEKDELWHPSVTKLVAYDIRDSQNPLGVVYCDWFDRERKCGEAHFTIRCGRELQSANGRESNGTDSYQTPVVVLSFRIPPPKPEIDTDCWTTALPLTGVQTETILHEFGHAFHTLVGRTRYQHVSGTRCSTDLAEIPSTFMEHYVLDEKAGQALWGTAFEGHRMRTRTNAIMEMLNQSVLALTDLRLHSVDPEHAFVEEIAATIKDESPLPLVSEDRLLVFEHLVAYGAKYHSYIVAKALSALVWRRGDFVHKPFDKQSGEIYRRLLSYGGEKYPRELIELTVGDAPSLQSLAKSLAEDVAGNMETRELIRKKQRAAEK